VVPRAIATTARYGYDLFKAGGFKLQTLERLKGVRDAALGITRAISPKHADNAGRWGKVFTKIKEDLKAAQWTKDLGKKFTDLGSTIKNSKFVKSVGTTLGSWKTSIGNKAVTFGNYLSSKSKSIKWILELATKARGVPVGTAFRKVISFLGRWCLKALKFIGKYSGILTVLFFVAGIIKGFMLGKEDADAFDSKLSTGSALSRVWNTLIVAIDPFESGIAVSRYIKLAFQLRKFLKDDDKAFARSMENDKRMSEVAMSILEKSGKGDDAISPQALEWARNILNGSFDQVASDNAAEVKAKDDKFDAKKYDKVEPKADKKVAEPTGEEQDKVPVKTPEVKIRVPQYVKQETIIPNRSSISSSIPQYRETIIGKPSSSSLSASPEKLKGTVPVVNQPVVKPNTLSAVEQQRLMQEQAELSKATNEKLDKMILCLNKVDQNTIPLDAMHADLVASMDNVALAAGKQKTVVVPSESPRQDLRPTIDRRKSV
jgi:hypothetical protein